MLQDSLKEITEIHRLIDEDFERIASKALANAVANFYKSVCKAIATEMANNRNITHGQISVPMAACVGTYYEVHYSKCSDYPGMEYSKIIKSAAKRYGLILQYPFATDEPGFDIGYPLWHYDFSAQNDSDILTETYKPGKNLREFMTEIRRLASEDKIQIKPMVEYTTYYFRAAKFDHGIGRPDGEEKQCSDDIYNEHSYTNRHSRYDYGFLHKRHHDKTSLRLIVQYRFDSQSGTFIS